MFEVRRACKYLLLCCLLIKKKKVVHPPTPIITTYSEEINNASDWARHMFDDIDGDEWLRNPVNLKELEGQSTTNKEFMKKWRAIQKEFQRISNHT